ncbi:hypothetical protein [Burkholderia sola]|uniref:hypothetical protein n=1 Tax=Burkholderia sola TaxID=2843302 RepID=UPI0023DD70AE|nr:hypothetical protein [Burkholderia sola]MDF3085437.1 hypothetical protein [Burkholderia sola]
MANDRRSRNGVSTPTAAPTVYSRPVFHRPARIAVAIVTIIVADIVKRYCPIG